MKKFVLLLTAAIMIFVNGCLFAQENGDNNLFHFGLKVTPALSWFTPGEKTLANDGVHFGFGYGLTTEFGFTKNYAFSTGLEILNANGKLKFNNNDSVFYVANEATKHSDTVLLNRTYKLRYVNIPLLLKLKTNRIGPMTYFGQFGFDLAIKWLATANDNESVKANPITNSDVSISNDVDFIRLALNVGLGIEYNLSGTTSLVVSVNYDNGFTNALRTNSKMLFDQSRNPLQQKAVFNYVGLTVGVLF
jgi:hypothetical protein